MNRTEKTNRMLDCRITDWLTRSLLFCLFMMGATAHATTSGVRESSYTYDNTTGLLTSEVIEPNDSDFTLTTAHGHDAFGNQTTVTTSGQGITSRTTTTTFDARGEFPTTVANALGHSETWTYDNRFGAPLTQTGPNGLTTSWTYDDFGRVMRETRSDGTYTEYSYDYCTGVAGGTAACPTQAAYVVSAVSKASNGTPNAPEVKTYSDTHGRQVAADTQGFDGSTIRQTTEYDALGRTERESKPYFTSGGTQYWTTYTFDALGRVTLVTLPDSSTATNSYSGLTTTVTNDLSQTTTTVKNARGEIISVTDNIGSVTSYTYDAFGNNTSITDSEGNVSTTTYDKAGRKIASYDPDMGHWTYVYNRLGELISQTDAKGQTTTMAYDLLGRPTSRDDGDETSSWVYDTGTKAVGKLTSATRGQHVQSVEYDSLGRPFRANSTLDGVTETFTTTYDLSSRVETIEYPSGFTAEYLYNTYGYEYALREQGATTHLWTANTRDAELRLLQDTAGNGIVTNRTFDQAQGTIDTIQAGTSASVADFAYGFDTIGNLTERHDYTQTVSEIFNYDNLNRLTCYGFGAGNCSAPGTLNRKDVSYDATGNITYKTDVGTYSYQGHQATRPHAVTSTSGVLNTDYGYDANGNMIYGAERIVRWTSFNKISQIYDGGKTTSFTYGAERQRVKMVSSVGSTYYYGAAGVMAEKLLKNGNTKWTDYLVAGGAMVGVHISDDNGQTITETTNWFVLDHLGSVAVITDDTGSVVERLAYDAWGKRRYPDGTDDNFGLLTSSIMSRGFTGHEMLDDTDLVNMNGRVYDPSLGRFLSADPIIPDMTLSQALNRFAYVYNNPLSYTDPSGHIPFLAGLFIATAAAVAIAPELTQAILAIAAAVAIIHFAPLAFGLPAGTPLSALGAKGAIVAGVAGGTSSVIATGRPEAFISGFGQGVLTFGVGSAFAGPSKVLAHGVVGGTFAEINGGKFSTGFLVSGFSSAAGFHTFSDTWQNVVYRAVVGGVASEIGGGKFADGAVSGAFVYLANDYSHQEFLKKVEPIADTLRLFIDADLKDPSTREAIDEALVALGTRLNNLARTVFVTGGVNATPLMGGGFSEGVAWDRRAGTVALIGSRGFTMGINLGAARSVGFFTGGMDKLLGWSVVVAGDLIGGGLSAFYPATVRNRPNGVMPDVSVAIDRSEFGVVFDRGPGYGGSVGIFRTHEIACAPEC